MITRRKIAIDMDDVLADFHTGFMNYNNLIYGTSLRREDFTTYQFNELWGGTVEEAIQRVNDFHRSVYFREILPLSDSIDSVGTLSKGNELVIITSRPTFTREETARWLDLFFKEKFSGIFYSSNHYSGTTGKSKSEFCKELGLSVLIDDSLDYVKQCPPLGISGILFGDYPWNQNGNLPSGIVRVKNWKEVLERLS